MNKLPKAKLPRAKIKNRKDAGRFIGIPMALLDSPNYLKLSFKAIKLLLEAGRQYNGFNNGDICLSSSLMRDRGWNSNATLQEALEELVHYGFLMLTRQGGRNKASLYAITWKEINDCKGKLDVQPTRIPPGTWKEPRATFIPKRKK